MGLFDVFDGMAKDDGDKKIISNSTNLVRLETFSQQVLRFILFADRSILKSLASSIFSRHAKRIGSGIGCSRSQRNKLLFSCRVLDSICHPASV